MKLLVSYILLLSYLTIIFRPAMPVLDYVLHYHYYAEVVCENKDKPEMHCNGQCHLKKEIHKVMDDESAPEKKKTTLPNTKFKEFTLYYRINLIRLFYFKISYKIQTVLVPEKCRKGFLTELLKPPQIAFS